MRIGSIIKDTFMLFIITLVLVAVLAFAKEGTKDAIAATNLAAQIKAFNEVCPGYVESESIKDDVVGASAGYNASLMSSDDAVLRCKDASGNTIGYIVQCTSKGFGGPLNLIVGFDTKGTITGVRYANTPSETPGLGMKTTEMSFLESWENHNSDDVDNVDTISGATVSSTAFKEAMKLACMFANRAATMDGGI
ncbi:MAG: FMN-binding protein [Lachnospiraceae bacterium]|nr:FMN-binding protein [Lachnospiraceae bacterium]